MQIIKNNSINTLRKLLPHPFHLVDPSPWPIITGLATFGTAVGNVLYFQGFLNGGSLVTYNLLFLTCLLAIWWRDIIRESSFGGFHTCEVVRGLRWGFGLFILSEVLFFFPFFWTLFYSFVYPSIDIYSSSSPNFVQFVDPFGLPLANTMLLLHSGITITWAHKALIVGSLKETTLALGLTIVLGTIFLSFQAYEYSLAGFCLCDNVYTSIFYITTGLHGFHVLIGTLFLGVCFVRLRNLHFTKEHHLGFKAAIWYWHFVDVVWLFVYLCIYVWIYRGAYL